MTGPDPGSLERIIPEALEAHGATGRETLRLHVERYQFAAEHLAGGDVLDLACGVGYGSALLGSVATVRHVVAADLSRAALRHAKASYAHPAVSLVCGDGGAWCRPACFDAVVSLETMEHVPDPRRLFHELVSMLRPAGVLIVSVPTTPSVDANPHHRSDFTEGTLLALGRGSSLEVQAVFRQVQPFSLFAVAFHREQRTEDLRRGLLGYYLRHPGAAARRLASLLRFGFTNRYMTVAWRLAVGTR